MVLVFMREGGSRDFIRIQPKEPNPEGPLAFLPSRSNCEMAFSARDSIAWAVRMRC